MTRRMTMGSKRRIEEENDEEDRRGIEEEEDEEERWKRIEAEE